MYNLGSKIIGHLGAIDKLVNNEYQFPITCEIDLSNFCQNDCSWCIYSDYIKSSRQHLDFRLFKNIITQLREGGCRSITLTGGGEPLMHPAIIDMLTWILTNGFKVGLITNGIFLDKIIPYLHHFEFVRVSLDAVTHETYKRVKNSNYFNLVCDNIRRATYAGTTDLGISMVYSDDTKEEAQQFSKLGDKLGVKYSQVKPLVNSNVENISYELNEIKDSFVTKRFLVSDHLTDYLPCKIAGLIGQVAANGKYYYCCIHRGNKKYEIGDLRTESLKDIIKKRAEFVPDLKECFSCRYMNYAKEYLKVKSERYQVLRHIDFM